MELEKNIVENNNVVGDNSIIENNNELVSKKELDKVRNNAIFTTMLISSSIYSFVFIVLLLSLTGVIGNKNIKLDNILELYDSMYIGEVEYSDIVDGAIQGIVIASEDKYGGYIPAIQKNTVSDKINTGKYKGFGFTYGIEEGYIEIKDIVEDSSAGRSKLKIGDRVTHINNELLTDEVLNNFILKVSNGTIDTVLFTLSDSTQIELEAGIVNMPKISTNIVNNVGYIKIHNFVEDTVTLFKESVDKVIDNNVEEIIFDLRGNNGGSLDAVVDMLDYITKDILIVKIEYKTGENVDYYSDSNSVLKNDVTIKILVDNETASAAELFTMCLQDAYKARVIGQTTYGKSTVLSNFIFKDGSMLAMSTGYYHTLNGLNIEGLGITPDIDLNDSDILKNSIELYETGLLN